MTVPSDDIKRSWAANTATMVCLAAVATIFGLYVYNNTDKDYLCYETNTYFNDEEFIDVMIKGIIAEGDYGGKIYRNKEEYLTDKTECCRVWKDRDKSYIGFISKPKVYVSAKYYNSDLKEYVYIQRHFNPCGYNTAKLLKRG